MARRVLVLGGGTGGLIASKTITHLLHGMGRGEELEVTVVTDSPWHDFRPLYADVAFGTARPDEVRAPIKSLERLGVRVVIDEAKRIDLANRRVVGAKGEYGYDYLVVALGVRYGWEDYPGFAEAGYHNYTLEGALELSKALAGFRGGTVAVLVPEVPHRCGMYPHEAVTMLAEHFHKRGVRAEVKLVAPYRGPMARLSPEFAKVWNEIYERYGIELVRIKKLEEVDPRRRLIRAGNVEEKYDLLIKVPPSRLPRVLEESEGFAWKQDPRWARVDPKGFRHPDYDDVFLTGEHSMPPAGLMTAGIPVHFASEYAAEQIASEIIGGHPVAGLTRTMTCVGYYGSSSGLAGNCEVDYDENAGKWKPRCYVAGVSPIIRLMKEAFYKAWIASLK